MADAVLYETEGRIAFVTLNRPEARNAVNGAVASGMEAAIDQLEDDPDVWVGILRANTEGQERPVFSAGADLKELNAGNGAALNTSRGGFAGFAYRDRRKPVIVAVDGLATAGGCEIVLACDLVVATTRSAFGLAEVKRNLVPGAGGLYRLPWAVGQATAMEAILTGEPIPAERAYALGMVSRLVRVGEAEIAARRLGEPGGGAGGGVGDGGGAAGDDQPGDERGDGLRGPPGRSDGVHREASCAVEGTLSARETVINRAVIPARS
jgi:enoyl-CoA hydratase